MSKNVRSRNFGGSGAPLTVVDWVQHKKTLFPVLVKNGRFETPHDVDQYLSGDRLVCLECGAVRRSLGQHLHMHDMTAREYKAKYNIPFSRGLRGEASRRAGAGVTARAWAGGSFADCRDSNVARFKENLAKGVGTKAALKRGYIYALKRPEQSCEFCGKPTQGFPTAPHRAHRFCSNTCRARHLWAIGAFKRAKKQPEERP